jgi:hypothetical protein
LSREYKTVTSKIGRIYVFASRSDTVLSFAFPVGNLVGEMVISGHPYFSKALGREGPSTHAGIDAPCSLLQIPDGWDYGHGDYLPGANVDKPMTPPLAIPTGNDPPPRNSIGWKSSWSAGVIATEI